VKVRGKGRSGARRSSEHKGKKTKNGGGSDDVFTRLFRREVTIKKKGGCQGPRGENSAAKGKERLKIKYVLEGVSERSLETMTTDFEGGRRSSGLMSRT